MVGDWGDFRESIKRGEFAEKASSLVALKFGTTLKKYLSIVNFREQAAGSKPSYPSSLDVANKLGILQGRGGGNLDEDSLITRQEAATMLARTYQAYGGEMPNMLTPLAFADQKDIADWAMDDVQLMNHLGIMTGVGNNHFDPLGSYSIEQCFVTLLRLHESTAAANSNLENPFAMTPREDVIADNWYGELLFTFEREKYYIFSWWWSYASVIMGAVHPYISIIEPDLSFRQYELPIIEHTNYYQGTSYRLPENATISEDGTKLIYTVTVKEDVYYSDKEGKRVSPPAQPKGIYTVTMDLKAGEQTYTRADLP